MPVEPSSHGRALGTAALEEVVDSVELHLAALAEALRERDSQAIELQSSELHRALANAVQCFMHSAQHGGVPDPMRRRLARVSATVARQRESLARATAALDRAIDVLMPDAPSSMPLYTAYGYSSAGTLGGAVRA